MFDLPVPGNREAKCGKSYLGTHMLPALLYCLSHLPNNHTNFRTIFHKPGFKTKTFLTFVLFSLDVHLEDIFPG